MVEVERQDLENRFYELEQFLFVVRHERERERERERRVSILRHYDSRALASEKHRRDVFPAHLFTKQSWIKWSLYVNAYSFASAKLWHDDMGYFMIPGLEFVLHTPDPTDGVRGDASHQL